MHIRLLERERACLLEVMLPTIEIMLPTIFVLKPFSQRKVFQVCLCLVLLLLFCFFLLHKVAISSNFTTTVDIA